MTNILVIDKDGQVQEHLTSALEDYTVNILSVTTAAEGLKLQEQRKIDVILLNTELSTSSSLDVFNQLRSADRRVPIIFIADEADSDTAIEAMMLGAFEYLAKPLDRGQLRSVMIQAMKIAWMINIPVAVATEDNPHLDGQTFIGRSPEMLDVFKHIGKVARQDVTVLLRGESGTGKELAARAIYQHSERCHQPFMAVNCAALPDNLLESELFGHEKGSFTGADRRRIGKFEQCNGGTIFLDEIGDMSPLVQGKILRLLQEQEFERVGGNETIKTDVRVIAATNRPLEEMVEEEEFREDLYYRLKEASIYLPALRERRDDIRYLIQFFLNRSAKQMDRDDLDGLSEDALAALLAYDWPGNVRELQNVIKLAVVNCTSSVIIPEFLPDEVRGIDPNSFPAPLAASSSSARASLPEHDELDLVGFIDCHLQTGSTNLYADAIEHLERYLFKRVLQETGGNQSKAAEILGITRGKVRDRIQNFGINVDTTVSSDPTPVEA